MTVYKWSMYMCVAVFAHNRRNMHMGVMSVFMVVAVFVFFPRMGVFMPVPVPLKGGQVCPCHHHQ